MLNSWNHNKQLTYFEIYPKETDSFFVLKAHADSLYLISEY